MGFCVRLFTRGSLIGTSQFTYSILDALYIPVFMLFAVFRVAYYFRFFFRLSPVVMWFSVAVLLRVAVYVWRAYGVKKSLEDSSSLTGTLLSEGDSTLILRCLIFLFFVYKTIEDGCLMCGPFFFAKGSFFRSYFHINNAPGHMGYEFKSQAKKD